MAAGATHKVYIDRHGRRMVQMTYEQRVALRKNYIARIPRWRHPVVGFFFCLPLVGLALLLTQYIKSLLDGVLYFPGAILLLAVLFISLCWGAAPSLLAVAVSTVAIDYYFIPPTGHFTIDSWHGLFQILPYIFAGLTVALITSQRERARLNALATEQELQSYTDDLEALNQRLEDANQTKDRFISIASHELKTPITTIRGQAQLTLRRLSKQKELTPALQEIRQSLDKINEQTGRLTKLIDELLDVSSIRSGKVELNLRKHDLRDVCREVIEDQRMLTNRQINLILPQHAVKTLVDGDRLAQVVVNLVSNAVKYSAAEQPVDVAVRQQDKHAIIEVKDYGKGIAKDQQERIFDTFYRTPDAQSSSTHGLGLGLAICKEIVERHNGRIWCESELKKGSTFCVELPIR